MAYQILVKSFACFLSILAVSYVSASQPDSTFHIDTPHIIVLKDRFRSYPFSVIRLKYSIIHKIHYFLSKPHCILNIEQEDSYMNYRRLNTNANLPQVILGVFQITDHDECVNCVYNAIKAGYRAIDTAASYGNEKATGEAIQKAITDGFVTREELFIISKMWVQDMKNYETAKKAITTSLNQLGLTYLDLYLEHQAMGNYFEAYRAMEDA